MDQKLASNRVDISKDEWYKAGVERYGKDITKWKFRCPSCNEVFSIEAWDKERFKGKHRFPLPVQDCPIALYSEDSDCIWSGFGSLNPVHIKDEGIFFLYTSVFDFADRPLGHD
jgi:hypothetical protein